VKGTIKLVNRRKKFGFILGEDGRDYHFHFCAAYAVNKVVGTEVSFNLRTSRDGRTTCALVLTSTDASPRISVPSTDPRNALKTAVVARGQTLIQRLRNREVATGLILMSNCQSYEVRGRADPFGMIPVRKRWEDKAGACVNTWVTREFLLSLLDEQSAPDPSGHTHATWWIESR
jgi:cold shock CspA family protein